MEVSIKPQRMGFRELLVGEHLEIWAEWWAWREHGSSTLFPNAFPYVSLTTAVPEFYPFITNQ